ncbi:MAG: class I mannose-6-phosphate isomerase [Bacteroidota bacterium]
MTDQTSWRKSSQNLMPGYISEETHNRYDIYPAMHLTDNLLNAGFDKLAERLATCQILIIDGYSGVYFEEFRARLNEVFLQTGVKTTWYNVSEALKSTLDIEELVAPFLGEEDPLFGKRTTLNLPHFFDQDKLQQIKPDADIQLNIMYGCGASLAGWQGTLVYIDLPKNEIQYRSRAGSISNLGTVEVIDPKAFYKRCYFVDWVVLNRHKQQILPKVDIFIDSQRPGDPVWMEGDTLRESLHTMALNVFRVRPWFEPGAWGGTWMLDHLEGLSREVPNYAWSFELIAPENGLLLESSGIRFEISFDSLMFLEGKAVLGDCFQRFGTEFPIRFDFLDTFDGGNLSIQCHPRPEYMKSHYGESFTQEETYYILDTKDKADVFLGFCDDIDPSAFRCELEESYRSSKPVDIEKYVQKHAASKHDLFLIPSGTIHGSGKNNLVLEISSTPYIFTFKMYDWLRPDLDGKPRPLNIQRGMENLYFDRKGSYVKERLIAKPVLLEEGEDWKFFHLPTHLSQLYDVHRYHFHTEIEVETHDKCHVLSLVEGKSILVETGNGFSQQYNYAETFIIPAAAGHYKIINLADGEAMLVKAFVRSGLGELGNRK